MFDYTSLSCVMAWLIAVVSIVCLHHSVSRQFNRCSFFMQLFATATVHPYYCSFGRYLHLQHTLRKRKNKKQQEMKRKKCLWKSQRPGCSFCPKMLGVHRQTFLPDEEAPASLPKHPRGAAPKSSPKRTTVQGTQHFYPNDSAQEFWNIIFRVWLKHVFPFLRPRGSVGREARGTKRERSESPPKRRFVRRTKWWQDRDILPTGQYEEKMCVCVRFASSAFNWHVPKVSNAYNCLIHSFCSQGTASSWRCLCSSIWSWRWILKDCLCLH